MHPPAGYFLLIESPIQNLPCILLPADLRTITSWEWGLIERASHTKDPHYGPHARCPYTGSYHAGRSWLEVWWTRFKPPSAAAQLNPSMQTSSYWLRTVTSGEMMADWENKVSTWWPLCRLSIHRHISCREIMAWQFLRLKIIRITCTRCTCVDRRVCLYLEQLVPCSVHTGYQ